jgi:hypothetical protein
MTLYYIFIISIIFYQKQYVSLSIYIYSSLIRIKPINSFEWWYQKYSKDQNDEDAALYEKTEGTAQKLKVGLWVDPDPTLLGIGERRNIALKIRIKEFF